jgi:hypothetical protein
MALFLFWTLKNQEYLLPPFLLCPDVLLSTFSPGKESGERPAAHILSFAAMTPISNSGIFSPIFCRLREQDVKYICPALAFHQILPLALALFGAICLGIQRIIKRVPIY